jgi:small-conductance mechanosensitive channel
MTPLFAQAQESAPPSATALDDALLGLLPVLPEAGVGTAARLLLLGALALLAAAWLARARAPLRSRGLLPTLTLLGESALRVAAAGLLLAAVASLAPGLIGPAVPWVAVAAAIAVGWSLREVARDWVAGIVLAAENRITAGTYVSGDGFAGSVERVSLRTTRVRTARGATLDVPNRALLSSTVGVRATPWPTVTVRVTVADGDPLHTRERLVTLALACPWIAPGDAPTVAREDDGSWRIEAHILDADWTPSFTEAMRSGAARLPR